MAKLGQFLAVPNFKEQLSGKEMEELVGEAEKTPGIESVKLRRSHVKLNGTLEAIQNLKGKFGERVIIEEDNPIHPF